MTHGHGPPAAGAAAPDGRWRIFLVFLRLGLTSFGGPVAHLGYFREELVVRRRWFDEAVFADVIALTQLLPGPASSQVSFAAGLLQGGIAGAFLAWLGFTLPSAVAMTLFGYGVQSYGSQLAAGILHGLQVVAVAVVAQAVWSMGRALAPDRARMTIAVLTTLLVLARPGSLSQICAILAAGTAGWWLFGAAPEGDNRAIPPRVGRRGALACLALFFVLLGALPIAAGLSANHALKLVDSFYRSGALVFGGGHVVLPLLQSAVVAPGWIGNDAFLAGYGAAQAVPGPLFTFAAYLGAVMTPGPSGWQGAVLCLLAIYLPTFLLVLGAVPFWGYARTHPALRSALVGINAAVVGLLLAALYRPVWTSAIAGTGDFMLALAAFLLLAFWRVPPWLVVILAATGGWLLAAG